MRLQDPRLRLRQSEQANTTVIARIDWFSHRSTTQPSLEGSQQAALLKDIPPPIFCNKTHVASGTTKRNTHERHRERGVQGGGVSRYYRLPDETRMKQVTHEDFRAQEALVPVEGRLPSSVNTSEPAEFLQRVVATQTSELSSWRQPAKRTKPRCRAQTMSSNEQHSSTRPLRFTTMKPSWFLLYGGMAELSTSSAPGGTIDVSLQFFAWCSTDDTTPEPDADRNWSRAETSDSRSVWGTKSFDPWNGENVRNVNTCLMFMDLLAQATVAGDKW